MFSWNFVIGSIVVVSLLMMVINSRAAGKIAESVKAQLGVFGNWAWSKDIAAVYQQRIDDAAADLRNQRGSLEQYQAGVTRLSRQVEAGKKACDNLEARIKLKLAKKDREAAAQYALQLENEQRHLEENSKQLDGYQKHYDDVIGKIKTAQQRIKEANEHAKAKGLELKMSRDNKELAELGNKLDIKVTSLEGLGEVEEEMNRQIDTNNASVKVATDLDTTRAEREEEDDLRKQKASDLLAKFEKEVNGIHQQS